MLRLAKPLIGALLFFYCVFLVLSKAPATLVVATLSKVSPSSQLYGVSGTVWSGKAAGGVIDLSGVVNARNVRLDTGVVRWSVNPWSFFALKACVRIDGDRFSGNACRSITGLNALSDFQADLPIALANSMIPEVELDGLASLNLETAVFNDVGEVKALKGQMTWRRASASASGMLFTLGEYAADLSANGQGGAIAEIFELSGPIKVNLKADVTVGQEPRVNGQIIPGPEAPPQISDALSFVATPRDGGGYNIAYPMGG